MDRKVLVEKYYPAVLSNALEFQDLANAENPEFKTLYDLALKWFENGFVMDLHEDGAERWESMLRLTPKVDDSLEQRRQRILGKVRAMLPYTHRRLEDIVAGNFGVGKVKMDIKYNKYLINANIDRSIILQKESLYYLLRMIVPANMIIKLRYTIPTITEMYFVALVARRKRLGLTTSTGMSLTNAVDASYFGGIVGTRKIIKIKAVN